MATTAGRTGMSGLKLSLHLLLSATFALEVALRAAIGGSLCLGFGGRQAEFDGIRDRRRENIEIVSPFHGRCLAELFDSLRNRLPEKFDDDKMKSLGNAPIHGQLNRAAVSLQFKQC
ncbi:hypothetical protein [Mesorhizobium sp. M0488]|uniref:hypothetical protein n=1 Tax=unclassified Mesorhizobium TaxID=325217 RepID=UPI0033384BF9